MLSFIEKKQRHREDTCSNNKAKIIDEPYKLRQEAINIIKGSMIKEQEYMNLVKKFLCLM